MRRVGSYSEAIDWIAYNDDTGWLDDAEGPGEHPSVTLHLVADVFGREIEQATADLRRALKRASSGSAS